jgi:hypothetical protein
LRSDAGVSNPQHRGDLGVALVCLHGKKQREPLFLRQCPDHPPNLGESVAADKRVIGARRLVGRVRHFSERQVAAELLPPRLVEAAIGHDPVEPGRERRPARLPGIGAPPQHDEDLLGNIIGVGGAAGERIREAAHRLAMAAHETGEGAPILIGNAREKVFIRSALIARRLHHAVILNRQ